MTPTRILMVVRMISTIATTKKYKISAGARLLASAFLFENNPGVGGFLSERGCMKDGIRV